MKKIAVIGSGIGGLSAASRLAHQGYEVHIYEKNSYPGGKASQVIKDNFRFDRGPSLLTMPFVLEELFNFCHEDIKKHISYKKLDILCKYFFPSGNIINAWSDTERFKDEIDSKTSDTGESLKKYLDYCRKIYDLAADIFLFHNPRKLSTYLSRSAIKALLNINKIDIFRTMDEANRSFFRDEKLIQLFNRYATYNGSDPYKCPATLNIISHVEYNLGGYYIHPVTENNYQKLSGSQVRSGGIHSLTYALYQLALKKRVKFHFNSEVREITTYGRKIRSIRTDDEIIPCDVVLSNIDVYLTMKLIDKQCNLNIENKLSSSALVFYWGVKITSSELEIHNILFSQDYRKEFRQISDEKIYPEDPTIYIYISSKFNPSDAPDGYENWFVMINTPEVNPNLKNLSEIREKIISKIRKVTGYDIENLIVAEEIMTPYDLENLTGSYKGAIYGISSNNRTSAFMRQSCKSKHIKGLYFCGGTVHPGGGIPLVIISGKNAADEIIQDYGQLNS
ncbi:MAG: phytoene desaturase family protein [Ignavibacteria bacterium]|nr:phytoene desaturase family protein [Ignavibacteria bacterium]